MLCGLVFLTTEAGWWGCQLQFTVHMFSLLCSVRSLTRTTYCSQDSRWQSFLCDLGIVSALMRVFFSLKLTLLLCCSPLALSFARMSACSFPDIPQWAGIHSRTALLQLAVGLWPGLGAWGFDVPVGRIGRQRGRQPAYGHDLKPALWRQPVWVFLFLHSSWSSAFQRPCLLCLSVLLGSGPVFLRLRWSPRWLPIGEYIDPCFLWTSLSNHSQDEGLLHCVILCVSNREGRDCDMDVDVSYVRYPGLWHVRWEEGKRALRQPVLKLTGQLPVLMYKTASFQPVLGETLQPGLHGMVWHAPELVCLHHNLGVPPLT